MKLSTLQKGLVGSWNLDEQSFNPSSKRFTDATPYENHGTGQGTQLGSASPGFQADRMGQLVKAAPFNGTDDCIRIPDSASLSSTSTMTAMVWVKGTAQNNKGVLSQWDYGVNQRSSLINVNSVSPYDKLRASISDDGIANSKRYDSSITAFDNTWHLVGFTFDAGTLKLFIDGVEDTNPTKISDDAITTIHNSTADAMVGCYLSSDIPVSLFTGNIAEPRIYNRALSAAEITSLAEQYRSKVMI